MNAKTKRQIAARLLLAVFLPMLLLASVHVHPTQQLTADECHECVNHHCGGHLGQQTLSLHDCVLCQLLTLPVLLGTLAVVVVISHVSTPQPCQGHALASTQVLGVIVLRGPPAPLA